MRQTIRENNLLLIYIMDVGGKAGLTPYPLPPYPLPLTPLPLTYLPLTYVTANRTFQIEFYDGKQANAGRSLSFSVTISIQREAEYAYIGGMSSLFPVVVVHQHDLYFLVE